ncbi:MAG: PIG-L family deacetylase [Dehalococcoidia bacterium]|nr:PIG-L family deacetylase [Dehalococcoidia bacterium]
MSNKTEDLIERMTIDGQKRALVVMAHPDDNEFVCGGTVALLSSKGWSVHIIVTTSGNKGTQDPSVTPQQLAFVREQEQRHAAEILGAEEPTFMGFPDGYIENSNELRGLLVRQIRLHRPDLVITWDGFRSGFNHRDHRRTGRATYDAIYPAADDHLYYPVHKLENLSPHRPSVLLLAGTDNPDYLVDITPVMNIKVRSILAHESQMGGRTEAMVMERYRKRAVEERSDANVHNNQDNEVRYQESFRVIEFG